jgi:diguanylate cyclase (GGDEF)-like protein
MAIALLCAEIQSLKQENRDLEIALQTSHRHGDLLEEHLMGASMKLAAEVRERQVAEDKLRELLEAATREKLDLEILVQILIDQGDASAAEGEQARIDGLTMIPNRRRFDEYFSLEWARHRRAQLPISLMICDVDHFKLFNDRYGHLAGDDCLKAVASVIRKCTRRNGDMVARYGGEEFVLLLPNTPLEGAVKMAEQVRESITAAAFPHAASPVSDIVTLSIGIACSTPAFEANTDAQTLIEEADQFLYLAKNHGRNRVGYREHKDSIDVHD